VHPSGLPDGLSSHHRHRGPTTAAWCQRGVTAHRPPPARGWAGNQDRYLWSPAQAVVVRFQDSPPEPARQLGGLRNSSPRTASERKRAALGRVPQGGLRGRGPLTEAGRSKQAGCRAQVQFTTLPGPVLRVSENGGSIPNRSGNSQAGCESKRKQGAWFRRGIHDSNNVTGFDTPTAGSRAPCALYGLSEASSVYSFC